MKKVISIILMLQAVVTAFGMDENTKRINAIKMDPDYLYGEARMQTLEEATAQAFDILQKEVCQWAQDSLKLSIVNLADTIVVHPSDSYYRVFAYVKKSDIKPSEGNLQPEIEQKKPKDSLVTDSVKQVIMKRFFGKRENDALFRIKEAKNFFELKEIMKPLKEEGKITEFGKYSTAENVEQCYLIVYDPAGNIRALLGKGNDIRLNLKTGKDDSVRNYRGCGAIWFKLKE